MDLCGQLADAIELQGSKVDHASVSNKITEVLLCGSVSGCVLESFERGVNASFKPGRIFHHL
jgi:hypothetical protein